jgi:hypothetical protein
MPKDMGCEGANESCEQGGKKRVIPSPPLDHLPRCWPLQKQASDIEGRHPQDQDWPANRD